MAASSYDEALARLLAHEGGYSNHPADPGGPTKFGITIADYRRYLKADATAADVRAMTIDAAKAIYRRCYWDTMRCDELPAGVDDCIFDYAVHSGTGRAPKVLQRCLGIAVSGKMDAATLEATRHADGARLIDAICDERLRFLRSLKIWPVFGRGWSRRVAEVRAFAHTLTQGKAVAPAASRVPRAGASGKAVTGVSARAQATSTGAVIAVGAAAAARADKPATLFVVVVATIAVAAGAWLFWRWWQRRKQEAHV